MGRSKEVIPAVQGENLDEDPGMEFDEEMGQKLRLDVKFMSACEPVIFFKKKWGRARENEEQLPRE